MPLRKLFSGNSKWWKLLLLALIIIAWLGVWYFPWQAELHHIYWLQLGVGLAIFIIPGLCVYGLLSDRPSLEFNHITFGFAISHLILALLGTMGRFIHLSFEAITSLMMALGLLLLLVYVIHRVQIPIKFQMDRERGLYLFSTFPALLVSLLAGLIVIHRVLTDDDLTYLSYVTNWQYATHLDFNDLIFGELHLVNPRFWLMSAPFAQAFLAKVSSTPGILVLGGYYEPFLVVLSVLVWYELAIALKFSPRVASASVILQLTFLLLLSAYLHPGSPYYTQLSVDKSTAAFILAPVFFQSLIRLLEQSTWNNKILLLLTGLSLTFMHPVILAYSVFIGGMFVLFNGNSGSFRKKLIPMLILIAIMIPPVAIRFVKVPGAQSVAFNPEVVLNRSGSNNLIARWENTRYYGFNPQILTMSIPYEENIPLPEPILKWVWLLVPVFAFLFALQQRHTSIAQFIMAGFAVCFLAAFPWTGWIIGYFLNARMLARSVWLFPFGLCAVFLLVMLAEKIKSVPWVRLIITKQRSFLVSNLSLTVLTVFSVAVFMLFLRENNMLGFEKFTLKSIRYQDLAKAGQTLDQLMPGSAVVVGSPNLNDMLPGISWKSQLITFRIQSPAYMPYFTPAERETRISDTQQIFSQTISTDDRLSLLRKYNVHFLLLQRGDLKIFSDLIASYPDQFMVTEIGGVYLVQIH